MPLPNRIPSRWREPVATEPSTEGARRASRAPSARSERHTSGEASVDGVGRAAPQGAAAASFPFLRVAGTAASIALILFVAFWGEAAIAGCAALLRAVCR